MQTLVNEINAIKSYIIDDHSQETSKELWWPFTLKETVIQAKDGTVSKDYNYTKTTSTIASEIGAVGRFGKSLLCIF